MQTGGGMAVASDVLSESGGEEGDYESDSDGTSTLALRRRAASDDEEDDRNRRPRVVQSVVGSLEQEEQQHTQDAASSSVDGDGSRIPYSDEDDEEVDDGVPPLYEEEEEEDDEEEDELLEEDGRGMDVLSRQLLTRRRRKGSEEEDDDDEEDELERGDDGEEGSVGGSKRGDSPERTEEGAATVPKEGGEEEKKDAEPFVVPTAGAFYMHDDRFRENGGARPRRSMGGRKLWEAKDEKPWVHDLFEELNLDHDNFAGEGFQRGGRGRGRARGRGRSRGRFGADRVNNSEDTGVMRSRAPGRGRGSRAEGTASVLEETFQADNYVAKVPKEAAATTLTAGQDHSAQASLRQDIAATKKPAGSYLNSASPPFIPSGALQQKLASRVEGQRDTGESAAPIQSKGREQYGSGGRNSSRGMTDAAMLSKSGSGSGRGSGSGVQSSVYGWSADRGSPTSSSKQPLKSSASQQQTQTVPNVNKLQNALPSNQSGRGTAAQNQTANFVRIPPSQGQAQQPQPDQGQSSAPMPLTIPQSSSGVVGNNSASGRYKGNGGGRGARASSIPGGGRGSYIFAGSPNAGVRVGEPGFQQPPGVGPVAVQYGGQSPAGMGVPAVGMPMANYPYGFPNSEVTWVPVLAGGGAIGAGYGAPYIAMEGAPSHMYYTPAAAQPAPGYHLPGREINGAKHQPPGGLWKPPPSPELGTDEFGQRQGKPRRYSEMNFGQ